MIKNMDFRYEDWSEGTATYGIVAFYSVDVHTITHIQSQVELILIEKGSLRAKVSGREFTVDEGNGLLICPHVLHQYSPVSEGTVVSTFIFSTEFLSDFKAFFESGNVPFVKYKKDKCPEFARNQTKYLIDFSHNYSFGKTVMKGLLTAFLSGIMPAYSGGEFEEHREKASNFEICRQLLLYIDNNISQDLSLEKISKALNIVPSYVSTVFSRNFNTSLNSYIARKRVSCAKLLLINSQKTITEIAFESGFSSIRSFNRRFKDREGLTPSEYRESFMQLPKDNAGEENTAQ